MDITAQQGSRERWTVRADMPQSFHIEGVSFLIRNVNGAMPFPEDRGWKDTVWVDGGLNYWFITDSLPGPISRSTLIARRWKWQIAAQSDRCW